MVDVSLPQPPSSQALVLDAEVVEKYFSLKSAQQGELEKQYRANGISLPSQCSSRTGSAAIPGFDLVLYLSVEVPRDGE